MELLDGIYSRRSVREFTEEPLTEKDLREILTAGSWAPSGLNNQPWRFMVVRDRPRMGELAKLTTYGTVIESSRACIVVCADSTAMYDEMKDHMALGACVQNMLLAAHALGLGAVWIGQILNRAGEVLSLLEIPQEMKLAAVVALGRPAHRNQASYRKPLSELMLGGV